MQIHLVREMQWVFHTRTQGKHSIISIGFQLPIWPEAFTAHLELRGECVRVSYPCYAVVIF